MEPYRLREWLVPDGRLFTCGRPGRSKYKDAPRVPDRIIHEWVENLPGPRTVILSLLGSKPDSSSEFSSYPFRGGFDHASEQRPTLQSWLQEKHPDRAIEVREYPTIDFRPIPEETLAAVAADIRQSLVDGKTVVVVDSGGQTRTGAVCAYAGIGNSR